MEIEENTLVIHCRSGNIFYGDWNSLYTQNSLNYFLKISQNYEKSYRCNRERTQQSNF